MTRKTALKEFIKLFNEDMDYMRGEEYDKMKKAIIYDYNKHELSEGEFKKCELYAGKIKTYFDDINSILKSEIEIKDGIIKGEGKEYHKNKRIKYIGTY